MTNHLKQNLREVLSIRETSRQWSDMDEVFPGIFVGGAEAAKNTDNLKRLGVTHVLNACYSTAAAHTALGVTTSPEFYESRGMDCKFLGIAAQDFSGFLISKFFDETSAFIDDAIKSKGKVLVHCFMGVSRSATIVMAYLMTVQKIPAVEALKQIRSKRPAIYPNDGFLDQLCELENKLRPPK